MTSICIFSRAFYPAIGGLERIAQILATEFSSAGHVVEVVTDTAATPSEGELRFPFKITRTSRYRERIEAFRRADVVLSMNISLHGLTCAWLAGKHVVATHQSCYGVRDFRSFVLENAKQFLMRFVENISCSAYVAHQIRAESTVIPNTYDDSLFKQPSNPKRDRDFVFCGRLVSDKGADVCVRAFSKVLRVVPDTTLTVIGSGPQLPALEKLAEELSVSGSIRFTGALSGNTLVQALQRHACMVVPSLWEEPFGIVALEGVACCDTVIVSRRGGLPEAVGDCGLVVKPTVEHMAKAMTSVALASRAGEKLPGQADGATRLAHLTRHTPEGVARQYMNVIDGMVGR